MFNIGAPEMIFILVLALLIFGPKRLPQLGRTLGRGMAELRRASTELQRAFNTELEDPPRPRVAAARPPQQREWTGEPKADEAVSPDATAADQATAAEEDSTRRAVSPADGAAAAVTGAASGAAADPDPPR